MVGVGVRDGGGEEEWENNTAKGIWHLAIHLGLKPGL